MCFYRVQCSVQCSVQWASNERPMSVQWASDTSGRMGASRALRACTPLPQRMIERAASTLIFSFGRLADLSNSTNIDIWGGGWHWPTLEDERYFRRHRTQTKQNINFLCLEVRDLFEVELSKVGRGVCGRSLDARWTPQWELHWTLSKPVVVSLDAHWTLIGRSLDATLDATLDSIKTRILQIHLDSLKRLNYI